MRTTWCCTALSAAIAVGSVVAFAAQDPGPRPTFRADVDLTVVEVTVRDRDGALLTDLRRDEFQVSGKKTPIPIEQFSVDRQPVTAALMVQTMGDLPAHRQFAEAFVEALGDGDRLKIGSYGLEVAVSPHLTADRQVLRRILDEELWPGSFYPVTTAVHRGILALPPDATRPAVVLIGVSLLSNCGGVEPCVPLKIAREAILERGGMVYGIVTGLSSIVSSMHPPRDAWQAPRQTQLNAPNMLALTKETGAYLSTRGLGPLAWPEAARGVLEQLRIRYVLGFMPSVSGLSNQVAITVSRPGATVRVQKSRQVRRQP